MEGVMSNLVGIDAFKRQFDVWYHLLILVGMEKEGLLCDFLLEDISCQMIAFSRILLDKSSTSSRE